jgi:hypothetical protein
LVAVADLLDEQLEYLDDIDEEHVESLEPRKWNVRLSSSMFEADKE